MATSTTDRQATPVPVAVPADVSVLPETLTKTVCLFSLVSLCATILTVAMATLQAAAQQAEPANISYTPEWQALLEHRKEIEKT